MTRSLIGDRVPIPTHGSVFRDSSEQIRFHHGPFSPGGEEPRLLSSVFRDLPEQIRFQHDPFFPSGEEYRLLSSVFRDLSEQIRFQHDTFPEDTEQASRMVLVAQDVEMRDRLANSQINKFLYQYTSESMPKQTHANMVSARTIHVTHLQSWPTDLDGPMPLDPQIGIRYPTSLLMLLSEILRIARGTLCFGQGAVLATNYLPTILAKIVGTSSKAPLPPPPFPT